VRNHQWLSLTIAILLWGCTATTGPTYTLSDLKQAEASGKLEQFYAKLERAIQSGEGEVSSPSLLTDAGKRLAAIKIESINASLNEQRLDDGLVPLNSLDISPQMLTNIKKWDASQALALSEQLEKERALTQQRIEQNQSIIASLKQTDPVKSLEVAHQTQRLKGETDGQALEKHSQEVASILYDQGTQALNELQFEQALNKFSALQLHFPGYEDTEDKILAAKSGVFSTSFIHLLEQGEADKAHQMFVDAASEPSFDKIKAKLGPVVALVSQFFSQMAAEATREQAYYIAYTRFRQSNEIKQLMEMDTQTSSVEKEGFIQQLLKLSQQAQQQEKPGLALGLVKVVEELAPQTDGLRRELRERLESVEDVAVKGVSTSTFGHGVGQENLGSAISSRITQYLFKAIPRDIRIVEREQLAAVLREQSLTDEDSATALAAADYFIEGNILEAKVDSSVKKGAKTMRVVTGTRQVPNPAYEAWSQGTKQTAAPPGTLSEEILENVSVNIQNHRKVGLYSAAYRLIESDTARVVFTDTVSENVVYNDQSSEGVQIGDFVSEHKFAELPSDIEILESLSIKVSEKIGEKLVGVLRNPEARYQKRATEYLLEDDLNGAVENFGYAYVMMERKSLPPQDVLAELKDVAVKAIAEMAQKERDQKGNAFNGSAQKESEPEVEQSL